jgi:hypothetical protein
MRKLDIHNIAGLTRFVIAQGVGGTPTLGGLRGEQVQAPAETKSKFESTLAVA